MEHKVAQGAERFHAARVLARVQFLQPGWYRNMVLLPAQKGGGRAQLLLPIGHGLVAQSLDVAEVVAGLEGAQVGGGHGMVEPAPRAHGAPGLPCAHRTAGPGDGKPPTYCKQPNLKKIVGSVSEREREKEREILCMNLNVEIIEIPITYVCYREMLYILE